MAGADSLFVPGLTDLQVITELAEASPLPLNVMVGPGAPLVAELAAAGVRRVSIGTAITQVACRYHRGGHSQLVWFSRSAAGAGNQSGSRSR